MKVKITQKKIIQYKNVFGKYWYKYSKKKLSVVGLCIIVTIIFIACFAPIIVPYPDHIGPFIDLLKGSSPPSLSHFFGTDIYGRDIFSRTLFAFRPALLTGVVVLSIIVPIGTLLGLLAGYYIGRFIDIIIMRIADIFLSLPALILALAISSILEPKLFNTMIAVSVACWPWYTRIAYSMTSSIRNEFYIKSAELIGESIPRILFYEVLPNIISPIFTKIALDFGWVIIISAALSFVGLGEQPPAPALGTMISEGSKFLPNQWWESIFPGLAIVFIILGFNLLGDGMRDMLASEEV